MDMVEKRISKVEGAFSVNDSLEGARGTKYIFKKQRTKNNQHIKCRPFRKT